MTRQRTAAIIGAGIGGLAAGISLRRAGFDVTVYERADEVRPLGAGLSIWPNGGRALRALGLDRLSDAAVIVPGGGALRRANGDVLAEFDPQMLSERYGQPLVGYHRADLHNGLIGALGASRIETGRTAASLEGGRVLFTDESVAEADVIVGADGINSVVREAILGDGPPTDSGIVAFRGVARWDGEVPAGEWWSEGSAAGLLPLRDGRVYWYVTYRGELDPCRLAERAADFGSPVPEVITATPPEEVLLHPLFDREPTDRWVAGNVALLGDAAHPMLPFLGQGACAALEDAVALGNCLAGAADPTRALVEYERARRGRAKQLVKGSRAAANIALARSSLGRRVRDFAIARVPASARLRQLDRVVGRG